MTPRSNAYGIGLLANRPPVPNIAQGGPGAWYALDTFDFSIWNGTEWVSLSNQNGGAISGLTGDVTATGPGVVPATLATVNSNVGTFGGNLSITVNGKGLVTAISGTSPIVETANFNALAGNIYEVTTTSTAITATLPAAPGTWDRITIQDMTGNAATHNITIARNGKNINGAAANVIINIAFGWVKLMYNGTQWVSQP
ncbi:hypothetical protein [Acidocella sp.]|jgi:hypothetical protein|uniref:hypothetical protein n=1 Tax=Acidocella sp. TaxID=50710 RepID=UPI002F3EA1EC